MHWDAMALIWYRGASRLFLWQRGLTQALGVLRNNYRLMMIRNVQVKDLTELLILEKHVFSGGGITAVTMRQQIDLFSQLSFVAERDARITGFVLGGVSVGSHYGWILDLAVHSEYRRKGIATALTGKCIQALSRFCKSKILLTVEPDTPARILYKKIGFKDCELDSKYFGENSPRVIMELNI